MHMCVGAQLLCNSITNIMYQVHAYYYKHVSTTIIHVLYVHVHVQLW